MAPTPKWAPLPPADALVMERVVGRKSEICDLQRADRSREKASGRAFSRGFLGNLTV